MPFDSEEIKNITGDLWKARADRTPITNPSDKLRVQSKRPISCSPQKENHGGSMYGNSILGRSII